MHKSAATCWVDTASLPGAYASASAVCSCSTLHSTFLVVGQAVLTGNSWRTKSQKSELCYHRCISLLLMGTDFYCVAVAVCCSTINFGKELPLAQGIKFEWRAELSMNFSSSLDDESKLDCVTFVPQLTSPLSWAWYARIIHGVSGTDPLPLLIMLLF